MSKHLTPVTVAERLLGNIEHVALICGNTRKAGYAWRWPSDSHDAGDFRSLRHVRALHAHARAQGIPLTLDHLIYGASEDEVAALAALVCGRTPAPADVAAE